MDIDEVNVKKNCLANLTPLSPSTNIMWKDAAPGSFMSGNLNKPEQQRGSAIWDQRFIDVHVYDQLKQNNIKNFLSARAKLIEQWLTDQTTLK